MISAKPIRARARTPNKRGGSPSPKGRRPKAPAPRDLAFLCREKRIRLTWQRRLVLEVIAESSDHPDAEEIYALARAKDPRISLSTVYRTVALLQDSGLVERHNFRAGGDRHEEGRARYEHASKDHHDHLIDLQSGRVIEFRNEEIEALQVAVAKRLGYRLITHRLELYGVPIKSRRAAKRVS